MSGERAVDAGRKVRILDEIEAVRRTLRGAAAAAAGLLLDQCRLDGAPPARTAREQEALAGVGERERRRLVSLLEALRRLDRGDYGVCGGCEGPIAGERLDVLPDTERCAACAALEG